MPNGKMMKDEEMKPSSGYSHGGMTKKKPKKPTRGMRAGYAHGGLACGADMKPANPISTKRS